MRSAWRSCRNSWMTRKVWLPAWGHPVLTVVGCRPSGPGSQSCRDEFTGGFRGRAAPGMSFVRHDARVCGNGPRKYTRCMGEEPGRSGLVYGRAAQWRSCRVLSGMVLAEEGRLGGRKMVFLGCKNSRRKGKNNFLTGAGPWMCHAFFVILAMF